MTDVIQIDSRELRKIQSKKIHDVKVEQQKSIMDEKRMREIAKQQIEKQVSENQPKLDVEKIVAQLKKLNAQLDITDKAVKLRVNDKINRVIITIVNKRTNEVITEYPYEELQNLAEHIREMTGVFLDTTV